MSLKSETRLWNLRHVSENRDTWCLWFQRQWSRGGVCLWYQRHWRGGRMRESICDFRDSEEGWECPVHHARMHHAPVQHALWTMDSCHCIVPPCTCTMPFATCPMHHHASCPVHHAPLSLHHAILHVQTCCYRLSTVQLSYSTHPIAWWMGSITINRYVICTT